jgi:hypothetical protein
VRAHALAAALMLAVVGAAAAALRAPFRLSFDGSAGARPGMSVAAVSARWGIRLRADYEVRPTCGEARIEGVAGIVGHAVFMPRGRFAGVFLRRGVVTDRGIRIGSTLAEVRRAHPSLTSRSHRFLHGTREYFARRSVAPHWELRIDVAPSRRVTQIAFGTHAAVRLDEGCA